MLRCQQPKTNSKAVAMQSTIKDRFTWRIGTNFPRFEFPSAICLCDIKPLSYPVARGREGSGQVGEGIDPRRRIYESHAGTDESPRRLPRTLRMHTRTKKRALIQAITPLLERTADCTQRSCCPEAMEAGAVRPSSPVQRENWLSSFPSSGRDVPSLFSL